MVTGAYHPEIAGGAVQCQTLIRSLRDRVRFTGLSISNNPALPASDRVDDVPVRRVRVDLAMLRSRLTGLVRLVRVAWSTCRNTDLVHLHGFTKKSVVLVVIARLLRKPLLLKLTLMGEDDGMTMRQRGGVLWRAYAGADRYVVTSPALMASLIEAGIPASRIEHIPNGVDVSRFRPVESREEQRALRQQLGLRDETLILFVGIIAAKKRPVLLFDAWAQLGSLTSSTALVFVGTTQSAYAEIASELVATIRARAAAFGLADRVTFTGETFATERYYRAADLLVLPSAREGLPNALMEAMASGLPCIASRLPGTTDVLIESGVDGLLVESGEVAPLAAALRSLLTSPDQAREIGRRARRRIETEFAIGRTADRHLGVYQQLAGVPTAC
jgi:glycosyltransferase involved in cell wall biosynthesis